MSSITQRRSRWRVQYRDDGRVRERVFRDRQQAETFAATVGPRRSRSRREVLVEEIEFMQLAGRTISDVADAYGMKRESVERACYRAGRPDLIRRDKNRGAR